MSQFTDLAASLTARQVELVKQGQDLVLAGVRKAVAGAPEAPEAVRALTTDLAARQAEIVSQGQDAIFAAVSSAIESLPAVPEVQVPEQLADSLKPVVSIVGTPSELKDAFVATSKTWVAVNREFSGKVVAEFAKTA